MASFTSLILLGTLTVGQPQMPSVVLSANPVVETADTKEQHTVNSWWSGFGSPEVLIAVLIPLAGLLTWMVKDYSLKNQELVRAHFKEEMINSFSKMLEESNKEKESLLAIKLQPLQYTIESLVHDLREGKLTDKQVEADLRELTQQLSDVQARMAVVETRIESVIDKLNREVSQIITNYLKDPIRLNMFSASDDQGPASSGFL